VYLHGHSDCHESGCLEIANLAYIEDVPILGLDHFVHVHILRDEPNHSLSMLYGRKVIWLPNPGLRLYSCESHTQQFDWTGEVHHSFAGPPHTRERARIEVAQQTMTTPRAHPQKPLWDTGYGGGYSCHHEGGSYYPPPPSRLPRASPPSRNLCLCQVP
jgi:hypothetical protein